MIRHFCTTNDAKTTMQKAVYPAAAQSYAAFPEKGHDHGKRTFKSCECIAIIDPGVSDLIAGMRMRLSDQHKRSAHDHRQCLSVNFWRCCNAAIACIGIWYHQCSDDCEACRFDAEPVYNTLRMTLRSKARQ